ncbi:MAG TPA: 4Fe-4S binding protein, partial [Methanomassiliicoccales archaeon]|nr:4Fe-4S binding protein [Methanomassiliicoccales archaeon]
LKEGRAVIDQVMCKGCARCAHVCPEKAITLHLEDMGFLERTVGMLTPLVDVTKDSGTNRLISSPGIAIS